MATKYFRLVRNFRMRVPAQSRQVFTNVSSEQKFQASKKLGTAIGCTILAGWVGHKIYQYTMGMEMKSIGEVVDAVAPVAMAAELPASQPSVYSPGKKHALYLWIELNNSANAKEVAKVAAHLQAMVNQITDTSLKDEEDEILAGVGFGPTFYKQVSGKVKQDFSYAHRRGTHGDMPSSGGDIFVHAKCNTFSKLFELTQLFLDSLPKGSVRDFEDVYSFVYKNGRDLSGFIDGTENAAAEDDRKRIAVEAETGGSYVVTQKWLHDIKLVGTEKDKVLEGYVGRSRQDSIEIQRKSISSHVARMTGGNGFQQKKPHEIVRQSMPFGTVKGGAGLFFIGYAASPNNLNFMLDQMVGAGNDPHNDDIMRLTKNVKGTYWYFPGVEELSKLG